MELIHFASLETLNDLAEGLKLFGDVPAAPHPRALAFETTLKMREHLQPPMPEPEAKLRQAIYGARSMSERKRLQEFLKEMKKPG